MFNKEPAIIINGLTGLLQQILPLLIVVGLLELSSDKLAGWVSIIGLVSTFVSTALLRSQVTSFDTANKQIQKGIDSPSNTKVADVIASVEAEKDA